MCNSLRFWMVFMAVSTTLSACGGGLVLPDDNSPAALRAVSGDDQEGTIRSRLDPLVVRVTDATSQPLEGILVQFVFDDDVPEAEVTPQALTDNDGRATAEVRLGAETGPLVVRAQVSGTASSPLHTTFELTAVAEEKDEKGKGRGRDNDGDDDEEDEDDDD